MPSFKFSIFSFAMILWSCSRQVEVQYGVNDISVYESKSSKIKPKNEAEYISILYTNLFQEAISPLQLFQSQSVMYSIGDQNVAKELVLSNYFNTSSILIPSDLEMRASVEKFIEDTYKRFYLRKPSEGEKTYFIQYIQTHPELTVEMVYTAFAASEEYGYY